MNDAERLNLKKMVKEFKTEETTDRIRELKHSKKIKRDVDTMIMLKSKYPKLKKEMLQTMAQNKCIFLWENYTNIFNKLMKDEIDVKILFRFINKLREIEEGIVDQHEASVGVGKILKEMYIDSALRHEKKFEEEELKRTGGKKKKERKPHKNISWAKFKASGLNAS